MIDNSCSVKKNRSMRRVSRAQEGNLAITFALSAAPLLIAVGAGTDLARNAVVRTCMTGCGKERLKCK